MGLPGDRNVLPARKVAHPFYSSPAWRKLMAEIIQERGRRCEDCGRDHNEDGSPFRIFGDHIEELRDGGAPLDRRNIKLRCGACHARKTRWVKNQRQGVFRGCDADGWPLDPARR